MKRRLEIRSTCCDPPSSYPIDTVHRPHIMNIGVSSCREDTKLFFRWYHFRFTNASRTHILPTKRPACEIESQWLSICGNAAREHSRLRTIIFGTSTINSWQCEGLSEPWSESISCCLLISNGKSMSGSPTAFQIVY